jgi:hypothetical protein
MQAAALGYKKPVLAKYDDEIDRDRAQRQRGFLIGDEHALEAAKFREMMVTPPYTLPLDYMDLFHTKPKGKGSYSGSF